MDEDEAVVLAERGRRQRNSGQSRPTSEAKGLRYSGEDHVPAIHCHHSGGICNADDLCDENVNYIKTTFYETHDKAQQDTKLLKCMEVQSSKRKRTTEMI